MLEGSNPTLWEGWSPYTGALPIVSEEGAPAAIRVKPVAYRSLVHSGGVLSAFVLSQRALGVVPTSGGVQSCTIRPHVAGLAWARGAYPTPQGSVEVAWEATASTFELRVICPPGVSAEV